MTVHGAYSLQKVLDRMQGRRVYFDTAPLIYALENLSHCAPAAIALLQASEQRRIFGFTGAITLAEILVKPLRANMPDVAVQLKSLFASDELFTCVDHSRAAYLLAAEIRAETNLKMVDALQCATAIDTRCEFLVTNDFKFKSSGVLEVVGLAGLIL